MTTVHYDITDVLEYARFNTTLSGIQRVSIQLINRVVNKHGVDRIRLIGYHPILKHMVSYDASYFGGSYQYEQNEFRRHFGLKIPKYDDMDFDYYLLCKYGTGPRQTINRWRLLFHNVLTAGRSFHSRKISSLPRDRLAQPDDADSHLAPGDIVFVGGATWGFDGLLDELTRARRTKGILFYHFVHDLIPLLVPEHVERGHIETFARWLEILGAQADRLLTNSVATKDDLDSWLAANGFDVETRVIPLAHQFADTPRDSATSTAKVRVLNAARLPYVLCVGTIESKKNVWTLANVWKEVHAKLGPSTPRLLFAGKHGWLKEDFDDFINGTGSLYGYIRIVDRPSDAELAYLYKNCLFSIFPSYKEGWGLPIGEGLWFGRPVICSNTSSMPEVGGTLADYVDPTSPQSIETAVLRMITDTAYREQRAAEIAAARLRTWSDVADDLCCELSIGAKPAASPTGVTDMVSNL